MKLWSSSTQTSLKNQFLNCPYPRSTSPLSMTGLNTMDLQTLNLLLVGLGSFTPMMRLMLEIFVMVRWIRKDSFSLKEELSTKGKCLLERYWAMEPFMISTKTKPSLLRSTTKGVSMWLEKSRGFTWTKFLFSLARHLKSYLTGDLVLQSTSYAKKSRGTSSETVQANHSLMLKKIRLMKIHCLHPELSQRKMKKLIMREPPRRCKK